MNGVECCTLTGGLVECMVEFRETTVANCGFTSLNDDYGMCVSVIIQTRGLVIINLAIVSDVFDYWSLFSALLIIRRDIGKINEAGGYSCRLDKHGKDSFDNITMWLDVSEEFSHVSCSRSKCR